MKQRLSHEHDVAHIAAERNHHAIVPARDFHRRLIALYLANSIELRYSIAGGYEPLEQFNLGYALADVGE